jgi:hypothetical protein
MQHITGTPRNQLFSSLEYTVCRNPVRVIYAFVEALALHTLDFSVQSIKWKVLEL